MVQCTECKNSASVYLAYSKKNLCASHFFVHFESRVKRTIRTFRLLRGARKVALGLSGGKDSTALLMCLKPICDSMRIQLTAIMVDEGIHNYREKLIAHAQKICSDLGVEYVVRKYSEEIGIDMDAIMRSSKNKTTACTYCGVFRRWILNKAAREVGADKLATGHNLDDAAQTILMNTLRNEPERTARLAFNAATENSLVPRIKPLIFTPEREAALYVLLKDADFPFAECTYARDSYRSEIRTFLNSMEEKFPGTKLHILNSFLSVSKALAEEYKKKKHVIGCTVCGEPSSSKICRRCWLAQEFVPLPARY